jgi:hypothetical protein
MCVLSVADYSRWAESAGPAFPHPSHFSFLLRRVCAIPTVQLAVAHQLRSVTRDRQTDESGECFIPCRCCVNLETTSDALGSVSGSENFREDVRYLNYGQLRGRRRGYGQKSR